MEAFADLPSGRGPRQSSSRIESQNLQALQDATLFNTEQEIIVSFTERRISMFPRAT